LIAYFDTSAIVPLVINEPKSITAQRLWTEAERLVSVRLVYPEARAALAQGQRMGRIGPRELRAAVDSLAELVDQIDIMGLTAELARDAGALAEVRGLRGYDAVHLAAALALRDAELVVVAADRALCEAAEVEHLNVAQL
jgi:predicted nucleic acid-binding protein